MGGRPTAPINPDPSYLELPPEDEAYRDWWHWGAESQRAWEELNRWKDFRKHQWCNRRGTQHFDKYKEQIRSIWERREIRLNPTLKMDSEQQTKLDEWEEFYVYQLSKLDRIEGSRQRKIQRKDHVSMSDWEADLKEAHSVESTHRGFLDQVKKQLHDLEFRGPMDGDSEILQTEYTMN